MHAFLKAGRVWPLVVLSAAFVSACANGPTLSRWSKVSDEAGVDAKTDGLQLFVSSAPVAGDTSSLTVKDLPDHAGAALIAGMAARDKTAAALRADVARPLRAPDGGGVVDTTKVSRVLLLGVQRSDFRPGDRLLATTISIRPVAGARFTDYSLAATDRAAINIGSVSVTNQQSANVSVAPGGAASLTEGLTAGFTASHAETSTRNVNNSAELSVHVAPDEIDAYRTGAEGLDLTGNTLIKLAVQLPVQDARTYTVGAPTLTDDDGNPVKPDKVTMATSRLTLSAARDVYVCARLTYTDRVILNGRESYDEGRQTVALRTGAAAWAPYLIVPYQDIETPLWIIMSGHSAVFFNDHIRRSELTFDDFEAVEDFTHWLAGAKQARLANGDLSAGTADIIDPIDYNDLTVTRLPQTKAASTTPDCP